MRKLLSISAVVAIIAIAVVPVYAQAPGPGTWNVGFTMQNLSSTEEATVHIDFVTGDGGDGGSWDGSIAANASQFLYSGNITGLAGETAATISSNVPLAAVANMASSSPKTEAAYSGVSQSEVADSLFAPGVYKNYYNNVSNVRVQNVGSSKTCVRVRYYPLGSTSAADTDLYDIAAGAGHTFDQGTNSALSDNFIGSATIESVGSSVSGCGADTTAGQPLAAIVNISLTPGPSVGNPTDMYMFGSYNAVTGGSSSAYVPVLQNGYYDNISALTVLNLRSTSQWVRVSYADGSTSEKQLAGDSSALWYTPNEGPAVGWFGGATVQCITGSGGSVTTDCEIVATINQINDGAVHSNPGFASYNGFTEGATSVRLPIANRQYAPAYGGYTTAITCQNVSDETTNVSLTLTDGNTIASVTGVGKNGRAFWYLDAPTATGVTVGWTGAATASVSNANARIVCIGQQYGYTPPESGDWLTTYNGVNE
jgi:hypothetical protein